MQTDSIGAWALKIAKGGIDDALLSLDPAAGRGADVYTELLDAFSRYFPGDECVALLSAPGRTELGGNHTDHQHGRVLAGAIDLDIKAVVSKNADMRARIRSFGHGDVDIDLTDLHPHAEETGGSAALVRGVASGIAELGFTVGGFDAVMYSSIPAGAGLSSSAAYEILIACIFDALYNDSRLDPVDAAKLAQRAENGFFMKPCGLMDQTACAVGGAVAIDFADPSRPLIERMECDFARAGFSLFITDTFAGHAGLTDEYAAIPREMLSVARAIGVEYLRDADEDEFYRKLPSLRSRCGDRACLRAMHFFDEDRRAALEAAALRRGDIAGFAALMGESGDSSELLLQNIFPSCDINERGVAMALALSRRLLAGTGGAWRVHGGGFAGSIQALVPNERKTEYMRAMDAAMLKRGACMEVHIRPRGAVAL